MPETRQIVEDALQALQLGVGTFIARVVAKEIAYGF
jgi:hypothetical protein